MKKEMRTGLLSLVLAGALLIPAIPLGASAFDAGIDQGADFNLSLGNTGAADTETSGSQAGIDQGGIAPQGSTTTNPISVQAAGTYDENFYSSNNVLRINEPVTIILNTTTGKQDVVRSNGDRYSVPGAKVPNSDGTEEEVTSIRVNNQFTLKMDDPAKVWRPENRYMSIDVGVDAKLTPDGSLHIDLLGPFMTMAGGGGTTSISDLTVVNDGYGPIIRIGGSDPERKLELTNVNFTTKGTGPTLTTNFGSTNSRTSIIIKGGSFTGHPAIDCRLKAFGGYSVLIDGATLDGNSSVEGNSTGIRVGGGADVTLKNTTIRNCNLYGIYADVRERDVKNPGNTANVTVENCTINTSIMAYLQTNGVCYSNLEIKGNNDVISTSGTDIALSTELRSELALKTKVKKADGSPWTVANWSKSEYAGVLEIGTQDTVDINCLTPASNCKIEYDSANTNLVIITKHNHWFSLASKGSDTITASCTIDGCVYAQSPMELKVTAPKSNIYNGQPVSATVTGKETMEKEGLTVTTEYYKGNTKLTGPPSEIGSYNAVATVKWDRTGNSQQLNIPFSVIPAVEAAQNLTYNGTAQELVKAGELPDDVKVYYRLSTEENYSNTIPTGTNAGTYTVQYYMTDANGNATYGSADAPQSLIVAIAKAQGTITFGTLTFVYDGQNHAPTCTVTNGYAFSIRTLRKGGVGAPFTRDVGTYTIEVSYTNNENYLDCSKMETFTITPKEIGITWGDAQFTYNGTPQTPTATATGLIAGDTCSITVEGAQTKAGESYTATAKSLSNSNYKLPDSGTTKSFAIAKKVLHPTFTGTTVTYTGNAQTPTGTIPAGDIIGNDAVNLQYDQKPTNAGNYTLTVSADNANYEVAQDYKTVSFTVNKFTPVLSNVAASIPANTTEIAKVTVTGDWTKPEGLASLPGVFQLKEGQTLTWGESGLNSVTCIFTPTDTANIAAVEVTGISLQLADSQKPTAAWTLEGKDWNADQYLNEDAEVTLSVTDATSGVKNAQYAIVEGDSGEPQWIPVPADGKITIPAQHGKTFSVKVKAEDKAGNALEETSKKLTFLTQPPVISLDATKTYYVTTEFSVKGLEIASVTRKNNTSGVTDTVGSTAGDNFTLPGDTDTTYTVTAADKAGNATTVTVTMKSINSILSGVEGITEGNVTTEAEETVTELLALCEELNATPGIKEAEKTKLASVTGELDKLKTKIDTVKDLYNQVLGYDTITKDTVVKSDAQKITDGLAAVASAEQVDGNLTTQQKAKVAAVKGNLNDANDLLKQVSDLEGAINALPNSVEPDDVDTVTSIRDLRSLGSSLSDHAQALVDEMCNAKLDALWAQATTYKIIKGDGKTWLRGDGDYEVTANGPYEWFAQLLIDGEPVEPDSYTAASGSTVVTLPKDYMGKLKDGKHTIAFVYENDGPLGQAEGTFTVQTPSNAPRTGDDANMLPYGIAIVAAIAVLAVLFVPKKRRKQ